MNQLEQGLQALLACQYVRCRQTQGMWLIEIVINGITPQQKAALWARLPQEVVRIAGATALIWKVYLYSSDRERFTAQGTLHTLPSTWENGMLTTTLSALDCYADITEFDGELIQMGAPAGHVIFGRESLDGQGQPILPYQRGAVHTWLEAMGGSYDLAQNGVALTNNQHPFTMTITLQ